jgi:hypothetical protein
MADNYTGSLSLGDHPRNLPDIERLKVAAVTMPGMFMCEEFAIL